MNWPKPFAPTLGVVLLVGCVPSDPPDGTRSQAAPISTSAVALQRWRPRPAVRVRTSEVDAGVSIPDSSERDALSHAPLTSEFRDEFNRAELDGDWTSTSPQWHLESGRLCGKSARNHPIWLKRRIPRNARITFSARTQSIDGDIKAELWGNGHGYAKGVSYNDATSYLLIFGGWKNQLHVLARLNEHDEGRLELRLTDSGDDPRRKPVLPNTDYSFVVDRTDGRTIVWRVNGVELFRFEDHTPLYGSQHDHFGFNNWETPVCFDDLTISPLPESNSGSH